MRHQGFDILQGHPLLDGAFHAHKPHPVLVLNELPHRPDPSVAEVIDIINPSLRILQTNKISNRMNNIVMSQCPVLDINIKSEFCIYFISADL